MAHLDVNDDLSQAWARVVAECDKTAGWASGEKTTLTVDAVISSIRPPTDVPKTTTTKAKRVVGDVLVCLQRFGEIASSAASAAFGPSQQCFNAVNFVIKAVQAYQELFEDLTTLMERVSVFLESLRLYLDEQKPGPTLAAAPQLDQRLRPNVYRVLEHFIQIMALTHKLSKNKAKVFVKVFFIGDKSVKTALATLETRISDVTRIQVAVIGKDLSAAARDIREMKGDMDLMLEHDRQSIAMLGDLKLSDEARQIKETEKADLEAIRSALGLGKQQSWRERHNQISAKRFEDTGSWLIQRLKVFDDWAKITQRSPPVLALSGPQQSGKTFLACAAIDNLIARYSNGHPTRRVAVAYFYAWTSPLENGDNTSLAALALKALIWQWLQIDSAYRQFVRKAVNIQANFGAVDEIWTKLVLGFADSADLTFLSVLDGVDKSVASVLSNIFKDMLDAHANERDREGLEVRMFMTMTADAAALLQARCDKSLPEIDLAPSLTIHDDHLLNREDVAIYIQRRLNDMEKFQDNEASTVSRQEHIRQTLLQHVKSDYARLDLILSEIDHCVNLKQLDSILDRVNESLEQKLKRQVEILNQSLTQDEIIELNAITCFFFVARFGRSRVESLCLDLVEEYLNVTTKSERLISLGQQIEAKYAPLLTMSKNGLLTWGFQSEVPAVLQQKVDSVVEEMARRNQVAAPPGEMALVEKMVKKTFSNVFGTEGDILFRQYGLETFFRSHIEDERSRITLDPKVAQLQCLEACLHVLCTPTESSEMPKLKQYALSNVVYHLKRSDRSRADADVIQRVGRLLVRLLREPAVIDAWLAGLIALNNMKPLYEMLDGEDNTDLDNCRQSFLFNLCVVHTFARVAKDWLTHPALVDRFEDISETLSWLHTVKECGESENKLHAAVMEGVARQAAKCWLRVGLDVWHLVDRFLMTNVDMTHSYTANWDDDLGGVERWILDQGLADDYFLLDVRIAEALLHRNVKEDPSLTEAALRKCNSALKRRSGHPRATLLKAKALLLKRHPADDTNICIDFIRSQPFEPVQMAGYGITDPAFYLSDMFRTLCKSSHGKYAEDPLIIEMFEIIIRKHVFYAKMGERHEFPLPEYFATESFLIYDGSSNSLRFLKILTQAEMASPSFVLLLGAFAAAHVGLYEYISSSFAEVRNLYRDVIQAAKLATDLSATESVSLKPAKRAYVHFLWLSRDLELRDIALNILEEEDFDLLGLAKGMLTQAKSKGFSSTVSKGYVDTLARATEHIAHETLPDNRDVDLDPRLRLARLYYLSQDTAKAQILLKDVLARQYQWALLIRDKSQSSVQWFYRKMGEFLGQAYMILNDHEASLTAWQLVGPTVVADQYRNPFALEQRKLLNLDRDELLPGGALYECSIRCKEHREWAYDMYICKDCINVVLMDDCYENRHKELSSLTCDENHDFLYIPPFDETEWRSLHAAGKMKVRGEEVPIEAWLQQELQKWGLDQGKTLKGAGNRIRTAIRTSKLLSAAADE